MKFTKDSSYGQRERPSSCSSYAVHGLVYRFMIVNRSDIGYRIRFLKAKPAAHVVGVIHQSSTISSVIADKDFGSPSFHLFYHSIFSSERQANMQGSIS